MVGNLSRINLFKNSLILLFGSGASGILQIISISLFIKLFGLEGYGLFVILRLFMPSGLLLFFDLGLSESLTRFISFNYKNPLIQKQYVSLTLYAYFFISIILTTFIFFNISFFSSFFNLAGNDFVYIFSNCLTLVSISIPFFFLGIISESILRGNENFKIIKITEFLQNLIFLFILIISFSVDLSLEKMIIYFIYLVLFRFLALFLICYINFNKIFKINIPSKEIFLELYSFTKIVMIGKSVSMLINNIILVFAGSLEVSFAGIYDAIMRIPRFLKSLISQFNSSFLPHTAKMLSDNSLKKVSENLNLIISIQFFFWTPLITCTAWNGEKILSFWLGAEFSEYALFFSLAFLTTVFYSSSSAIASSSYSRENLISKLNYFALAELILIFIMVFLFSSFGIKALLSSFLVSTIFKHFYLFYFFKKDLLYSFSSLRSFLSCFFISIVLLIIESLTLNLIDKSIFFVVIFSLMISLLSWVIFYKYFFSNEEKYFLKEFFLNFNFRKS